jgi:hypothetical protein
VRSQAELGNEEARTYDEILFPLVISSAVDTIPEVVEVKKHCPSRQE